MLKHMEDFERKINRGFQLGAFLGGEPAEAILKCLRAAGIEQRIVYPTKYTHGEKDVYQPVEGLAIRIGEWIKEERKRFIREAA